MDEVLSHPDPGQLRVIPLFQDVSAEDLERLASWMEVRHIDPGRRITPQGSAGYEFFVIEEGTADVIHDGAPIATLAAGDFFGEMAMMGDGRRMADVFATTPMTILAMFGTRFRELEADLPEIAGRIRATLEERISAL
jgi:cAMP-dependent protein kinase regulator